MFVNPRNLIGQSEGTKSLGAHLCRALSWFSPGLLT